MPAVSVLLPVRNGVPTLARAVRSLQRQTFTDWEAVVVDDGSSDGTWAMLRGLARDDARIKAHRCAAAGIVAALNTGLRTATGNLIARMDADDESHPERFGAQCEFLRREPDAGLVGCLVDFGGDRGAGEGYALHVDWLNALVTPEQMALNRFVESPLAHPSVMFRREIADRFGSYREGDFPEDYELWLRWFDAGVRMAKVPRVLLTWHDSPARFSRRDARYNPEKFFRLKAEWIARELRRCGGARPVLVWGAGRPTRKRASHLAAHGGCIAGYIDIDPRKTGRTVGGVPVLAPPELPPPGEVFVLGYVGTRGARERIRGELRRRGYGEGRDFLMCA